MAKGQPTKQRIRDNGSWTGKILEESWTDIAEDSATGGMIVLLNINN